MESPNELSPEERNAQRAQAESERIAAELAGKDYWQKKEAAAKIRAEQGSSTRPDVVPLPYSEGFPTQVVNTLLSLPLWEVVPGLVFEKSQRTYRTRADFKYLRDILIMGLRQHTDNPQLERAKQWAEEQILQPTFAESVKRFLKDARPKLDASAVAEFSKVPLETLTEASGATEAEQVPVASSPLAGTDVSPQAANGEHGPPADPWAGLLLNDFDVEQLDKLLFHFGLLQSVETREQGPESSPGAWVGVAEGLKERRRLRKVPMARILQAFQSRYGQEISSSSSFSRGTTAHSGKAVELKDRVAAFLPLVT